MTLATLLSVADTPEAREAWFAEGGEALRYQYRRRPLMHLIDYEKKMEDVRAALMPEPVSIVTLPPTAA